MFYTGIILIVMLMVSIGYAVALSIMTFENKNFPTIYLGGIHDSEKNKYHDVLYSSLVGSYINVLVMIILAAENIFSKTKSKLTYLFNFALGSFIFGMVVLTTFNILFVEYAKDENIFGHENKNNIDYNYPFFATLTYSVFFFIFGIIYLVYLNKEKNMALF